MNEKIEKIESEIGKAIKCREMTGKCGEKECEKCEFDFEGTVPQLLNQLLHLIVRGIKIDRLKIICNAERAGLIEIKTCDKEKTL